MFPHGLAVVVCLGAVAPVVACSLYLDDKAVQCTGDSDCGQFPNAVCDRGTSFCVTRPPFSPSDGSTTSGHTDALVDAAVDSGRPRASPDAATLECPDLDGNGVLDCRESLVVNPSFRADLVPWAAELDMTQSFLARDAANNPASGSIAVTNGRQSDAIVGSTLGGSGQCLPATALTNYEFLLQTLLSPRPGEMGWAGIAFQFYSSLGCAGTLTGAFGPTLSDQSVSGWQLLRGVATAPIGTRSFMVRLIVVKPFKQQATQAAFDNVLLKAR